MSKYVVVEEHTFESVLDLFIKLV